jgi:hypothetical protein
MIKVEVWRSFWGKDEKRNLRNHGGEQTHYPVPFLNDKVNTPSGISTWNQSYDGSSILDPQNIVLEYHISCKGWSFFISKTA